MNVRFQKLSDFLNNGNKLKFILIVLVIFLCIVKLPPLFTTEIQGWDEGMYAVRVLSLHEHGDFLDQSSHSVGGYYSASHPPLLIWIGWMFTSIFGINSPALKIIPFIFSILCLIYIVLLGKKLFDQQTGILAALVFSSTIIFNIFSKRFQFDIPYIFLIILAFYFFVIFLENKNKIFLYYCGIAFGLCLLIKILVGFFIPIILFISFIILNKKINFTFRHFLIVSVTGIIIAAPWHIYILISNGEAFLKYFIDYHLVQRALEGVEYNVKSSGIFYHVKYLITIIPVGILIYVSMVKDFLNYKNLEWKKIIIWLWFVTGMLILASFKTKLESYTFLILAPASYILISYILNFNSYSFKEKFISTSLTGLNILWYISEHFYKRIIYFINSNRSMFVLVSLSLVVLTISIAYIISKRLTLKNLYYKFVLIFFILINIYYLIFIPPWENKYKISELKNNIENSGRKKIIYIGTNYKFNPQFSFYFKGIDLGWESEYEYELLDTKIGIENVKVQLDSLNKNEYSIIVEVDDVSRSIYPDPEDFIPDDFEFRYYSHGYRLYFN